jgi:hypothetical protein
VRSSNRSYCNRAARLAVDSHGFREGCRARISARIPDIGSTGIAVQVDKMNHSGFVNRRLRLQSIVGSFDDSNFARLTGASQNGSS